MAVIKFRRRNVEGYSSAGGRSFEVVYLRSRRLPAVATAPGTNRQTADEPQRQPNQATDPGLGLVSVSGKGSAPGADQLARPRG